MMRREAGEWPSAVPFEASLVAWARLWHRVCFRPKAARALLTVANCRPSDMVTIFAYICKLNLRWNFRLG